MIDYTQYGIVGGGIHDDTDGLQRLINDHYRVVLPSMQFRITKPLYVRHHRHIEGESLATQIVSQSGDHSFFVLQGSRDVYIGNLSTYTYATAPDDLTTYATVYISGDDNTGCDGVTIENLNICNKRGRGIVCSKGDQNISIRHCNITESTIGVFVFKGNQHVDIIGNRITDSKLIGVYVDDAAEGDTAASSEPNYWTRIHDNTIEDGGTHPQNTGFGIAVSGSHHTSIRGNFVSGFGGCVLPAGGIVINCGQGGYNQPKFMTIESNQVFCNGSAGLSIVGGKYVQVRGNTFADNNQAKSTKDEHAEILIRNQSDAMRAESIDINHNHIIRRSGHCSWSTIGIDISANSSVSVCPNEYVGLEIPIRRNT